MNEADMDKILKAGKIAREVIDFIKPRIKKGESLLRLAEEIESEIVKRGGKPAFPVNLSIDEVAAHATPEHDGVETAHGLLKVDIGVHVDGFVADTAFSVDLEGSDMNRKLISAAEDALAAAGKIVRVGISLNEIGKSIQEKIESHDLSPVCNLSGHEIKRYDLHAGMTVPNHDNGDNHSLETGLYAIEPFSTNGLGSVKDGKPSGIYQFITSKGIRDSVARQVLAFINEEYGTLPFCSRWIHKKFGSRGVFALRLLEKEGILHQYAQLVESSKGIVAQAENTFLLGNDGVVVVVV